MANPRTYATEQFYNFNSYEGGYAPTEDGYFGKNDNVKFMYPGESHKNAHTGITTKVQRGYMRMITEAYGNDSASRSLAKRRFHFQFNPDVLVRSVTARNDVQFWMNQDPGQLVSPIPGDANFAFEFILNREAEVASGRDANGSTAERYSTRRDASGWSGFGATSSTRTDSSGHSGFGATSAPITNPTRPYDIGVLADLIVFDAIIGQGLNADLLNAIISKYNANVKTFKATNTGASADKTLDGQDMASVVGTEAIAKKTLNSAVGNSAFLISQPVRVVFSSLYMVEGFVTSSTVTFNKFNPAMVPTQCTVSINMQAMYIGFAAKDTFLTTTLRDANAAYVEDAAQADGEVTSIGQLTLYKDNLRIATLGYITPKEILTKSNNGSAWEFAFNKTSELSAAMKAGSITNINAHIEITMRYKGRVDGSVPVMPTSYYKIDDVVHTISADIQEKESAKGPTGATYPSFLFEMVRATPELSKPWDTNANALYEFEAHVTFDVDSPTVGNQPALDKFQIKETVRWDQKLYSNKATREN